MAHNFVHSFFSVTNYVDDGFVKDDLFEYAQNLPKGGKFLIQFFPTEEKIHDCFNDRIKKSIGYYQEDLPNHCSKHSIDLNCIKLFQATLAKTPTHKLVAIANVIDDRGKQHKEIVNI